jgi:tRNA 2-selenouridine synthase
MSHLINANTLLQLNSTKCIFDVRSPSEYRKGHVPSAKSLPLLNDDERKIVGTLYKKKGPQAAFLKGLEIVTPKMQDLVERVWSTAEDEHQEFVVYCARGGKRSESVQWILQQSGLKCIFRLSGGYQQFRHSVLDVVARKYPTIVLSGLTGVGKTKILRTLHQNGQPCIDLEEIARHRGSAFGGFPNLEQPSQQQFENELALTLLQHRDDKDVLFIEDESKSIGRCYFPPLFYAKNIKEAPLIHLTCSTEQRISNLLIEYGGLETKDLLYSLQRIEKRLGTEKMKRISNYICHGELRIAIQEMLEYYDRQYIYNQNKRQILFEMNITDMSIEDVAKDIKCRMGNL